MRSFSNLLETAILHKGSLEQIELTLPVPASAEELQAKPNSFYLSAMAKRVFQAGLKHSMVEDRWPHFEKALNGFDPMQAAMLSDSDIDELMSNRSLIRHLGKMKSVRNNASMMLEVCREYGSFGAFIAEWPSNDIVGLWTHLKKVGTQLGGMSGSRVLRMVGKDTFLLTNDVVQVLKAEGVVSKIPSSQKELKATQSVFNQWAEESGRPLCQISRIVSYTVMAEVLV